MNESLSEISPRNLVFRMFDQNGAPNQMQFQDFLRLFKYSWYFINLDSNGNGLLEEIELVNGFKKIQLAF
jgi:hypothetical protein